MKNVYDLIEITGNTEGFSVFKCKTTKKTNNCTQVKKMGKGSKGLNRSFRGVPS